MHEFLLSQPGWKKDPVHLIVDAREEVDSLRDTTATFKLKEVMPEELIGDAGEEVMAALGTWEMPKVYGNPKQGVIRCVNPNYIHSFRFPDCLTRCECGNIQTHPQPKDTEVDPPIDGANVHGDCKPYHRMEARAKLMRQREETILDAIRRGVERDKISRRIGFKGTHVSHVAERLEIDLHAEREKFLRKRGETMTELAKMGYKTTTIAQAYGLSRGHASKQIEEYGESLRSIRGAATDD